ncbi:MAG: glutamate--cysteine ligase [Vulcanococcus sp.]|jgi:predicted glutamate--cysteine ligase
MTEPLLLKGFEVELYTGKPDGTVVGCSAEVAAALEGFVTEPDCRNLEYITPPDASYQRQLELLLEPRRRLRPWLAQRGLTLLPGSTLSTGDSRRFERSDPDNPYHGYIEATYGTRVVTASVHINFGLTDLDQLFAACRLVRCEAALLLALSACSPFLDGELAGAHSLRWLQFPLTPEQVPLFVSHAHYVSWVEEQLALGTMQNVRHLWTSVRPNGENRPHDLNRLEIRICDLMADPSLLLAVTAFAELRLHQLLADPASEDPLQASGLDPQALAALADANDRAAASSSLDAELRHWRSGEPVLARDWIASQLEAMAPLAEQKQLSGWLMPLEAILRSGNQSMQWLEAHRAGASVADLIAAGARELEALESRLSGGSHPQAADTLG